MANETTHPDYYNSNGIEAWDIMEMLFGKEAVLNFCECSIIKYHYRKDRKGQRDSDILKIANYHRKAAELIDEIYDNDKNDSNTSLVEDNEELYNILLDILEEDSARKLYTWLIS